MKRKFLLIFILIAGLSSSRISAQPGNSKVEILQPVTRTNYEPAGVLTVNADNRLRFESADDSIKRFLLNASQGTVKQQGKDFIVRPAKTGDLALAIYNYDDIENPVLIEERNMTVVSSPAASIAGKNGGQISKEDFVKAEKIECSGNYTITEFKFSVAGKAFGFKEFHSRGETLTPDMIAAVQMLRSGEKIFVEFIRARPENSEATRQISPLSFTVTE